MANMFDGKYNSHYTGIQIDNAIDLILQQEDNLRELPTIINSVNTQLEDYNKIINEKLPGIENTLNRIYTNNYDIDILRAHEMKVGRQIYFDYTGTNREETIANAEYNSALRFSGGGLYSPVYSFNINRNILSMGVAHISNPEVAWYYNTTKLASLNSQGVFSAGEWNDFAEFRKSKEMEPGRVICENGDGTLSRAHKRLQPGAAIISDTYGFAIGENEICKTPVAVAGRVLAYPYEDKIKFKPGDAVCAGPNGTVSKMSRREIRKYPECIIGTVSELPTYETWGNDIPVNGRIWIKIK